MLLFEGVTSCRDVKTCVFLRICEFFLSCAAMPFLCVVVEVPPVRWLHSSWVGFDCSPDFFLVTLACCTKPARRFDLFLCGGSLSALRSPVSGSSRSELAPARWAVTAGNADHCATQADWRQRNAATLTSSRLIPILPYPLKEQMRHLSKSNAMIRAFKFTQASQIRCFLSGVQVRGRDDAGWVLFGMQLSVPRTNLLGFRTKARCKCDARILGSALPDPCQIPLMEWVGVPRL